MKIDMKEGVGLFLLFLTMLLSICACSADDSEELMALGRTRAGVELICQALDDYRDEFGSLPGKAQGLEILIAEQLRLKNNPALMDGWKRPFRAIVYSDSIVGAYSVGPNGKDERNAGDDVGCTVAEINAG